MWRGTSRLALFLGKVVMVMTLSSLMVSLILYLAPDYHIEQERGDQAALMCDSPVTNSTASYTYSELRDEVATLAGVLDWLGVSKGDRVIIYMPMIPQAITAVLACARTGAIDSVVFGGFATK